LLVKKERKTSLEEGGGFKPRKERQRKKGGRKTPPMGKEGPNQQYRRKTSPGKEGGGERNVLATGRRGICERLRREDDLNRE